MTKDLPNRAGGRLGYYSAGFLGDRRVARVLTAHGWALSPGPLSSRLDAVAVWGARGVSARARAAAKRRKLPCLFLEDALYRSVLSDKSEPLIGLMADSKAPYFEAREESDLYQLLQMPPALNEAEMARARAVMSMINRAGLSKYNPPNRAGALPDSPYVLVVDQVRGDASIAAGLAEAESFEIMVETALSAHPDHLILVRAHLRDSVGHINTDRFGPRVSRMDPSLPAATAIAGATAVYTVTSQLGFEAILAGYRPHVFGAPFYAGWGATNDAMTFADRRKDHDAATLVHRILIQYPFWYDPYRNTPADIEDVIPGLAARRDQAKVADAVVAARGISRWKRKHMQRFFGPLTFANGSAAKSISSAKSKGGDLLVWASREDGDLSNRCADAGIDLVRVEDGFLRSRGLGAALYPPLSLAWDTDGIYYDAARPSRLEALVHEAGALDDFALGRARRLREAIVRLGLSKYNLAKRKALPRKTGKTRVLVVGQVEDDASILRGAGDIRTNAALLAAARASHPDAELVYKPHPDVEAGFRSGPLSLSDAGIADHVIRDTDATLALEDVDLVWTMTSLMGFEALLRGVPVVVTGHPFYAGWGLTEDLAGTHPRRRVQRSIDQLVHAALIDYPIYVDPKTGVPCPVEVIVDRLASGEGTHRSILLGVLGYLGRISSMR